MGFKRKRIIKIVYLKGNEGVGVTGLSINAKYNIPL